MNSSTTVSAQLGLRLVVPDRTTVPVGDGDVEVWPADDDGSLNIALSSPFGDALFEVPLSPLADFLHRTYQAVPAGEESEFIDIDAELENLLWPS